VFAKLQDAQVAAAAGRGGGPPKPAGDGRPAALLKL